MRPLPLDYIVAGMIAVGTAIAGQSLASNISDVTRSPNLGAESILKFNVGDTAYRVKHRNQCIGTVTIRAREDSVIGVFIDAEIRVWRDNTVFKANSHSSFAFNPLLQLFEGTVDLSLATKKFAEIKLRNVRPHEISITGEGISASPLRFAIPGPIMLNRDRNHSTFSVRAPQDVLFPTAGPGVIALLEKLDLAVELVAGEDIDGRTKNCDSRKALNLNDLESAVRSMIPKGFSP